MTKRRSYALGETAIVEPGCVGDLFEDVVDFAAGQSELSRAAEAVRCDARAAVAIRGVAMQPDHPTLLAPLQRQGHVPRPAGDVSQPIEPHFYVALGVAAAERR